MDKKEIIHKKEKTKEELLDDTVKSIEKLNIDIKYIHDNQYAFANDIISELDSKINILPEEDKRRSILEERKQRIEQNKEWYCAIKRHLYEKKRARLEKERSKLQLEVSR